MIKRWVSSLALAVVCVASAATQSSGAEPAGPAGPGASMDYGPFLTGSLDLDPAVSAKHARESTEQTGDHANNLAAKAVNVRLRAGRVEAAVAFDTDLLRYAAGWTGGFVNLNKTHLTSEKGTVPLSPAGKIAFKTPLRTPGWATSHQPDAFKDPRPGPFGPLPRAVGQYKGLYRHGDRVVFGYTVGDADVLDMPGLTGGAEAVAFTRTLRVGRGRMPLSLLVCEEDGATVVIQNTNFAKLNVRDGRVFVNIEGGRAAGTVVHLSITPRGQRSAGPGLHSATASEADDLEKLVTGGPSLWGETVRTAEYRSGATDKPYVVDELTLPQDNPWRAWVRPTGFDFFADGKRAALCTWNGDVWVVSGIGGDEREGRQLTWRRFAAGLYEPLGLRIVNDLVYVTGRDQITRLNDLNADGEADFYECFNNDGVASANYHGFAMELQTDAAGNFYYTRCGQRMHPDLPGQGVLVRVSPDGSKSEFVASGLRAANGVGVGPDGEITTADNQGNWMPACRINLVKPGGFYGYMPHARAAGGRARTDHDPPLCWLPMSLDSSSGSQVWVPPGEKRWGPLAGKMLHTSYGTASVMLVLSDEGDAGVPQAGVARLPLSFASGVMRARFNPADGQLYLCGLKAWQSRAARDGTFCRVRYTGAPVALPSGLRVVPAGVELTFAQPLDPDTANDRESFGVERWNYRWSEAYGSPEFSAADPMKQGRDEVTVKSAQLRADGRTVFIELEDFKPVMQMSVRYDLDTKDGTGTMNDTVFLTVNRVPER